LLHRIRVEEEVLVSRFGEEYLEGAQGCLEIEKGKR
jgi:protein-S-isoprenylcysteine O-methyltransferase Ste14